MIYTQILNRGDKVVCSPLNFYFPTISTFPPPNSTFHGIAVFSDVGICDAIAINISLPLTTPKSFQPKPDL